MSLKERKVRPGQPIEAELINAIIDEATKRVTGPNMISTGAGYHAREKITPSGGVVSGGANLFAVVTASQNEDAPYVYKCQAVSPLGDGQFSSGSGDDFDLWNEDEIGAAGQGVLAIPNGSIVRYDSFSRTFTRAYYRGTYL